MARFSFRKFPEAQAPKVKKPRSPRAKKQPPATSAVNDVDLGSILRPLLTVTDTINPRTGLRERHDSRFPHPHYDTFITKAHRAQPNGAVMLTPIGIEGHNVSSIYIHLFRRPRATERGAEFRTMVSIRRQDFLAGRMPSTRTRSIYITAAAWNDLCSIGVTAGMPVYHSHEIGYDSNADSMRGLQ